MTGATTRKPRTAATAEAVPAAEAAAEMGFRLRDLVGGGGSRRSAPARPKHRRPEEPGITWSGRRRRPR